MAKPLKFDAEGYARFGHYDLYDWDYRDGKHHIRACRHFGSRQVCFTGKGSSRTVAARRAVERFTRKALIERLARAKGGHRL